MVLNFAVRLLRPNEVGRLPGHDLSVGQPATQFPARSRAFLPQATVHIWTTLQPHHRITVSVAPGRTGPRSPADSPN